MTVGRLQLWIDRLWLVSTQRWMFIALSLCCVAGASTVTALASGTQTGVAVALMLALAGVAVVRPDSHAALGVEVAMVWQWLATTDDATSRWTVPFAVLLLAFHTLIALMAVTPITASVPVSLLGRWVWRCGFVAATAVGVWAIVVIMDQRRAAGSVALTALGFVTLAALIVVTRAVSVAPRRNRPG
jgi:hypothetical protein